MPWHSFESVETAKLRRDFYILATIIVEIFTRAGAIDVLYVYGLDVK